MHVCYYGGGMMALILFPGIPEFTAHCTILFCGAVMLVTFVLYARFNIDVWRVDNDSVDCIEHNAHPRKRAYLILICFSKRYILLS